MMRSYSIDTTYISRTYLSKTRYATNLPIAVENLLKEENCPDKVQIFTISWKNENTVGKNDKVIGGII